MFPLRGIAVLLNPKKQLGLDGDWIWCLGGQQISDLLRSHRAKSVLLSEELVDLSQTMGFAE